MGDHLQLGATKTILKCHYSLSEGALDEQKKLWKSEKSNQNFLLCYENIKFEEIELLFVFYFFDWSIVVVCIIVTSMK
jgi:hypothetical protein